MEKTPLKLRIAGSMAAWILRLLYYSLRWHRIGFEPNDPAWGADRQHLFAFWHARFLMLPLNYARTRRHKSRPCYILISRHSDGRLIAEAVERLGLRSIAGSSSKGGAVAVLNMLNQVAQGADLGITPDGPKGPRGVCKRGVIALAEKGNMPIFPMSYSAKWRVTLGSWDGMIVPLPFSPAVVLVGDPITRIPNEDLETWRLRLEKALHDITARTDQFWDPPDGV